MGTLREFQKLHDMLDRHDRLTEAVRPRMAGLGLLDPSSAVREKNRAERNRFEMMNPRGLSVLDYRC